METIYLSDIADIISGTLEINKEDATLLIDEMKN